MTNEDVRQELEALRAQVAQLAEARAAQAEATNDEEEPTSSLNEEMKLLADELGGLVEKEFKNHPAASALAVFALGVLVGRALR